MCGKVSPEEGARLKLGWFENMGNIFGVCGKILYLDGEAVAYSQFAPPKYVENIREYERHVLPVGKNSMIITCLYVREGYRGRRFGQRLLDSVVEEVRRRGEKTLETYARDDSANNPSGPTQFYLGRGFKRVGKRRWGESCFSLLRLNL